MVGMLNGKVILVTGASRGIGGSAAKLIAHEGAKVMLCARTQKDLEEQTHSIREAGGTAEWCLADLHYEDQVKRAIEATVEKYGRLDGAFNNAGVMPAPTSMLDMELKDFDRVQSLNLRGVWIALVEETRAIQATAGRGAIVNNSSVASLRSFPGLGAYASTKRAINSLTESAAFELGSRGIRVNAICPGATITDMMHRWEDLHPGTLAKLAETTPLGRMADAEEVAEAAVWLLSDRSSYVTGACLPVDGGLRV